MKPDNTPAHESSGSLKYQDADVLCPYDEAAYDGITVQVALGANRFSKDWMPQTLPLPGLIHQLTKHDIGKKDGLAIVFGDMARGRRQKKAVRACTAIGLDIDSGTPSVQIDEALAKLNCLAVRY